MEKVLQEDVNPLGLYRMKRSEALEDVCARYGVPVLAVIRINGLISPPDEGQIIFIPKGSFRTHVVAAGESAASICVAFGIENEIFEKLNGKTVFVGQEVLLPAENVTDH